MFVLQYVYEKRQSNSVGGEVIDILVPYYLGVVPKIYMRLW